MLNADNAVSKEKENKTQTRQIEQLDYNLSNITINSGLSSTISVITLLLSLFMFVPEE